MRVGVMPMTYTSLKVGIIMAVAMSSLYKLVVGDFFFLLLECLSQLFQNWRQASQAFEDLFNRHMLVRMEVIDLV